MSAVICQTVNVEYRVVVSEQVVDRNGVVPYGVEGTDGARTVRIAGLSYDRDRINTLVDNMNKSQMELCLFNNVINEFLSKTYYL